MDNQKNLVIGRDSDGNTLYYTGRAGTGFVSSDLNEAFVYLTIVGARNRALVLNAGTPIHGIRFFAPTSIDWQIGIGA
jgi:hypothetical protein